MKNKVSKFIKEYLSFITAIVIILTIILIIGFDTKTGTDQVGNQVTIINNVALEIFGRGIYWYAIFIMIGITFAYLYGLHIAKKIGINENDLFDGFIWGVIIGVLGARIYYVIFKWNEGFSQDPIRIFTDFIHGLGGLAIHGAVIGAGIFAYFFCKKRKMDIYKVGEILLPGFFIGQIFGRWGNFFNQEAHGGPISSSITEGRNVLERMGLPKFIVDQMYVAPHYDIPIESISRYYAHPTFLYESLWNTLGLILIIVLRNKVKKYWIGDAVLFYLVWYGVGRFFIESLRTDSLMVNIFGVELRQAQVISVIMIIVGIVLFVLRRLHKINPMSYLETVEANK